MCIRDSSTIDLAFTRAGSELRVEASGPGASGLKLRSLSPGAKSVGSTLTVPLPAVQAGIATELPLFGAETRQMKVLDEIYGDHSLSLTLAAQGGSTQQLILRENLTNLRVTAAGAHLGPQAEGTRTVEVKFPDAPGYIEKTVTFHW